MWYTRYILAWMLNSLWQGSMLVAKTRKSPEMIVSNIRQARAYVEHLFGHNGESAALAAIPNQYQIT